MSTTTIKKAQQLPAHLQTISDKIAAIEEEACTSHLEREEEVRGIILALLSNSNCLLLGPPGTAKSSLIRTISSRVKTDTDHSAKVFQTLMTSFSTIEDLMGPISLKELENEKYIRKAKHSLKNCDVAFIDECFKGNAGALNVMLSAMNERIIMEEGDATPIPLLSLIGASNEVPTKEDGLDALVDRFNIKFIVSPLKDPNNWHRMLKNSALGRKATGEQNTFQGDPTYITLDELMAAREYISNISIPDGILKIMWEVRQKLHGKSIHPSDRVWVQSLRILRSEAFLDGRSEVIPTDLVTLKDALWTKPDESKGVSQIIYTVCAPDEYQANETFLKAQSAFEGFNSSLEQIKSKKGSKDKGSEYVQEAKNLLHELLSKLKASTTQLSRLKNVVQNRDHSNKEGALSTINKYLDEVKKMSALAYQELN